MCEGYGCLVVRQGLQILTTSPDPNWDIHHHLIYEAHRVSDLFQFSYSNVMSLEAPGWDDARLMCDHPMGGLWPSWYEDNMWQIRTAIIQQLMVMNKVISVVRTESRQRIERFRNSLIGSYSVYPTQSERYQELNELIRKERVDSYKNIVYALDHANIPGYKPYPKVDELMTNYRSQFTP